MITVRRIDPEIGRFFLEWADARKDNLFIRCYASCWGAYEGDKLIGVAGRDCVRPGRYKLGGLYVLPEYRGRGVGEMLLDARTKEKGRYFAYTTPAGARLLLANGFQKKQPETKSTYVFKDIK